MLDIKLKICGMRDHENIMKVASFRPDFMGFIFYAKSPRYVGEDFVLPSEFPSTIGKVGVFVNETTDNILRIAESLKLQFIQLHGSETPQQCNEIKSHNYQIIKAFSVDNSFDFGSTKFYLAAVDFFLFDTKGKYYGGNAQTFDWSVLDNYREDVPFFLSGGLSLENVQEAMAVNHPKLYALDVNSGIETRPGVKDIDKTKAVKDIIQITTEP
jgi:phosphoribosylanthranilate isomerase